MSDYILLVTLSNNFSSEGLTNVKKIIKKYDANLNDYADPIMCKKDHLIGKVFIPEDNVTLFWIDLLDKKYYFDVLSGKQ